MFLPHTPEALLSHAITAQSIAERHARSGDSNIAYAWRRAAERTSIAATRMLVGRPATAAVAAVEGAEA